MGEPPRVPPDEILRVLSRLTADAERREEQARRARRRARRVALVCGIVLVLLLVAVNVLIWGGFIGIDVVG